MIHQPLGGFQGQASDIEIHAQVHPDLRAAAQRADGRSITGQARSEQVARDTDRDNFLTAEQAQEYGIVDKVLQKRA